MTNDTICIVKNRSASMVGYTIPEDGIRREFMPGETRRLPYSELVKLSFRPGGRELMTNFLQIESEEATSDLNIRREPEYNMSEEQIVELITTGSLDAFLDCLDFAPIGVIDLLKKFSVSVPLTDYAKRVALKKKTGFDVDVAIKNLVSEKEEENEAVESASTQGRRVTIPSGSTTPGRRSSGSNYKIVKTNA